MKKLTVAFLIVACCATFAFAKGKFSQMDTNNDNGVTWEEFSTAFPTMKKYAFETIDKDGDTIIVVEEWKGFMSGHGNTGMNPPQGMMGKGMMGKGMKKGMSSDAPKGTPELIAPPAQ